MKILIFKTNIATSEMISAVKSFFSHQLAIIRWTIDTEDVDNVLRIEATDQANEQELIRLIQQQGFNCETLQ